MHAKSTKEQEYVANVSPVSAKLLSQALLPHSQIL